MAGGLVNRSQIQRLAPQPMQRLGLQQPAGGAYNGLGALPRTNVGQPPRQAYSGVPRAAQASARSSAKPAWLDAQYLSDLAGLNQGLTQQTSPIREQLTQMGYATGGFTPYQAAVRDINQQFQGGLYGMDASLAGRGRLRSGARDVGGIQLKQQRATNLVNANQEMGPLARARLRRQLNEFRQMFKQGRLAAQELSRERLIEKRNIAKLNKDQIKALQQQYPGVTMAQVQQAINANRGGGASVQIGGRTFNSFRDINAGGLQNQYHGLRKAAWKHLVNRDLARAQGHDLGAFTFGGATFTIGMDGRVRRQQQNYSQMQGPVFAPMGTRG